MHQTHRVRVPRRRVTTISIQWTLSVPQPSYEGETVRESTAESNPECQPIKNLF
jgi:hypothetical protein